MNKDILTQDKLKELFHYKDGQLYRLVKPSTEKYNTVSIDGKLYLHHRIVFLYHYGYLPKCVDHIDNNPKNNRIENLREATVSQNQLNAKKSIKNTSGIKGVTFNKKTNQWNVHISINKKLKNLGSFKDIELAELVAIEARNKYHGEFARHG